MAQRRPSSLRRANGIAAAGLIALVLIGFALRMLPAWTAPGGQFLGDAAYHARLAGETFEHGMLPEVDHVSDAPDGRRTAALLPVGMYDVAALGATWTAKWLTLDGWLQVMIATAGALMALAAFMLASALRITAGNAWIAAAAVTLMPGHLHRTFAWWLRYDALGSLGAVVHLALLAWALRVRTTYGCLALSIGSACVLVIAASIWRVSLVLPLLAAFAGLLWSIARPTDTRPRVVFTVMMLAATVGLLAIPYVREQHYLISRGWLLPLAMTGASWFPASWARPVRTLSGVALVAVAWFVGGAVSPGYDAVGTMVLTRTAEWLGAGAGDPVTRLMLSVEELSAVAPLELLGPAYTSALGVVVLVALIIALAARKARRAMLTELASPDRVVYLVTTMLVLVLTLLFARSKVLLAPLVAVAVGGAVQWGRQSLGRSHVVHRGAMALIAVAFLWTAWDAWQLMSTRRSSLDPNLRAMHVTIGETTSPADIIVAPWELGYDMQRYAGRATLMDGLLESRVGRERILAFARAAMHPSPDSLAAFCETHGSRWLLVPPSTHLYGITVLVDPPLAEKVLAAVPLTPREAQPTIIQMMVLGGDRGRFREHARHGEYRLMRLEGL